MVVQLFGFNYIRFFADRNSSNNKSDSFNSFDFNSIAKLLLVDIKNNKDNLPMFLDDVYFTWYDVNKDKKPEIIMGVSSYPLYEYYIYKLEKNDVLIKFEGYMQENLSHDSCSANIIHYDLCERTIIKTETYYGVGKYSLHEIQVHFYSIFEDKIELIAAPSYTWRGDDEEQLKSYFLDLNQEQEVSRQEFVNLCESITEKAIDWHDVSFEAICDVFSGDNLEIGIKNAYREYCSKSNNDF